MYGIVIFFMCLIYLEPSILEVNAAERTFETDWNTYFPGRRLPSIQHMDKFIEEWEKALNFERNFGDNVMKARLNAEWNKYRQDVVSANLRENWFYPYLEGFNSHEQNDEELEKRICTPEQTDAFPQIDQEDNIEEQKKDAQLCLKLIAHFNTLFDKPLVSLMEEASRNIIYATVVFKQQPLNFLKKQYNWKIFDHAGVVLEYVDEKGKWTTNFVHLRMDSNTNAAESMSGNVGNYKVSVESRSTSLEFTLWTTLQLTETLDHSIVPYFRYATIGIQRSKNNENILKEIINENFPARLPYSSTGSKTSDNCCTYIARMLESMGCQFFSEGGKQTKYENFWFYFSSNELRRLIKHTMKSGSGENAIEIMPDSILDQYLGTERSDSSRSFSFPAGLFDSYFGARDNLRSILGTASHSINSVSGAHYNSSSIVS